MTELDAMIDNKRDDTLDDIFEERLDDIYDIDDIRCVRFMFDNMTSYMWEDISSLTRDAVDRCFMHFDGFIVVGIFHVNFFILSTAFKGEAQSDDDDDDSHHE